MATGGLTDEQLEQLNDFLNTATPDGSLSCPVTGERVPITEWNAPDGVILLPGGADLPGYEAVPLTSPAGGVVLLSMVKIAALQREKAREPGEDGKAT